MMATGDVIGILNSDDFYTSTDILSTVADGIQQYDAVYADIHYVDPADLTRPVRHYSSAPFRRWKMRLGFMPAHPSFYCRRSVYTRFGLFDLDFKVAADFEQLLRLIYVNRIFTHTIYPVTLSPCAQAGHLPPDFKATNAYFATIYGHTRKTMSRPTFYLKLFVMLIA